MKFKLDLQASKSVVNIDHQSQIFLIGSCFTENIGTKLKANLFSVHENPHGILFNPMSVINALQDYIQHKTYTEQDLFEYNELYNSWQHHTKFSDLSAKATLHKINGAIGQAHAFLKTTNTLVITLGSAWLYSLTELAPQGPGLVVANNHKGPSNWFSKSLMDPLELSLQLQNLIKELQSFNSKLHIVFTISPVRHLREGLVENNRSKAALIFAVHDAISKSVQTSYFPAYEYVIDDLRDYRFYAEDLVHPNYAATQYVWEKMIATYFSESTQHIMKQVGELQLAMQHKPFNKASKAHQSFINNCLIKTKELLAQYPQLPLQEQLAFFNGELINIA